MIRHRFEYIRGWEFPVRAKARRLSETVKESAYMMAPDAVGLLILDPRFLLDILGGGDDGERNT